MLCFASAGSTRLYYVVEPKSQGPLMEALEKYLYSAGFPDMPLNHSPISKQQEKYKAEILEDLRR